MKYLIFISLLFFTKTYAQQPLSASSNAQKQTKQELMAWIAQEIKTNLYTEKFENGSNTCNYEFIGYKNGMVSLRERINWREGFGPEWKFYDYNLDLNKVQNVKFELKTGLFKLNGVKMTEFIYNKEIMHVNFIELNHITSKGKLLPILHNSKPEVLDELTEALKKLVKLN